MKIRHETKIPQGADPFSITEKARKLRGVLSASVIDMKTIVIYFTDSKTNQREIHEQLFPGETMINGQASKKPATKNIL